MRSRLSTTRSMSEPVSTTSPRLEGECVCVVMEGECVCVCSDGG